MHVVRVFKPSLSQPFSKLICSYRVFFKRILALKTKYFPICAPALPHYRPCFTKKPTTIVHSIIATGHANRKVR